MQASMNISFERESSPRSRGLSIQVKEPPGVTLRWVITLPTSKKKSSELPQIASVKFFFSRYTSYRWCQSGWKRPELRYMPEAMPCRAQPGSQHHFRVESS